ncbi:MAG: dipeptide ABC transporter ATP-binding protein [Lachnospiraceae bacterium]|nr:dipeptide ABC transporter ATP-binding protein [Lachnospiraceae bacterium]MDD7078712.1 dipeptide ABC transporter ATP-binding protein [Lachnospiraceae bacterium]
MADKQVKKNDQSGGTDEILLEVKNLKKYFPVRTGILKKTNLKAVDDVSFFIRKGETLGIVGESGCGKTTLGRSILRLEEPTSGDIIYDGESIIGKDMKPFRSKMQIVFQDPYASLDPRKTVADLIGEAMDIQKLYQTKTERKEKILDLMKLVGLNSEFYNRFPHEFSGGQRQRIGIARALAVDPGFIVCDEPVSALDVSIQAQIINMLEELQREKKLTYLFIAHDLAVVKHISTRIGVMYLGHMVELTDSAELYRNPLHPYTQMLLSAIPIANPDVSASRKRIKLVGEIPSPLNPPEGCPFCTRCPKAGKLCREELPKLREIRQGHFAACHNIS